MLWQLFKSFFVIGGFTFGGGYAMLPLIEREVVDKRSWMSREDFIDLFAVAQSLPGVFAVNISIFIGYRLRGVVGALICAVGCSLPSFLIILLVALFFSQIRENIYVERVFRGLRPVVVAMIAAPVFRTWRALKLPLRMLWIPTVVALAVWYLGFSPVLVIIASAAIGYLYSMYFKAYFSSRPS